MNEPSAIFLESAVARAEVEERLAVPDAGLLDLADAEEMVPRVVDGDEPAVEVDERIGEQGGARLGRERLDAFEARPLVLLRSEPDSRAPAVRRAGR